MTGFFDVEMLLATAEAPCEFMRNAIDCGVLDPTNDDPDIQVQQTVELPMWLAEQLASKNVVKVTCPRAFDDAHRHDLIAGADAVNLSRWSHYYYSFGMHVARLTDDEHLAGLLTSTFADRFHRIVDITRIAGEQDIVQLGQMFDSFERRLFQHGADAEKDFIRWRRRQSHVQQESETLKAHKRRKVM